jgi:hypothetical protein
MDSAPLVTLPDDPKGTRRRVMSAMAARQRLETPSRYAWHADRAWIDGRVVGRSGRRLVRLSRLHD